MNSYIVEVLIVAINLLLCEYFPVLFAYFIAFKAFLDLSRTLIDQVIEIPDAFLHSVSELAKEPLEFKHTSKHIPVLPRFLLPLLEFFPPPLDLDSSPVGPISVIDLCQLSV